MCCCYCSMIVYPGTMCRYATAGSQVTTILIATAIVPRIAGWVSGYIVPAFKRGVSRAYTQEHLHEMHLNPDLHLGDAFAEVALVAMQARNASSSCVRAYSVIVCLNMLCQPVSRVALTMPCRMYISNCSPGCQIDSWERVQ